MVVHVDHGRRLGEARLSFIEDQVDSFPELGRDLPTVHARGFAAPIGTRQDERPDGELEDVEHDVMGGDPEADGLPWSHHVAYQRIEFIQE